VYRVSETCGNGKGFKYAKFLLNFMLEWPTTATAHKPGVYSPNRPPYYIYFGIPLKPEPGFHKPGVVRPQTGGTSPNLQDSSFTQW
jgi:hypothetical protein